jgi:outer membrane protein assembly factor BamB
MATAISMLLIMSIVVSISSLPIASAAYNNATQAAITAGMNWTLPQNASSLRLLMWDRYKDHIPTQVYMVMSPNPVGVGQQVSFVLFMPQQPRGAMADNDIRYSYTVDVTKPDGTNQTIGPIKSDSTGTAYTLYSPPTTGNYTITVNFLELLYQWQGSSTETDYYGVTYKGASYTKTLVVQEEPILPTGWTDTPLPTEYWVRPIEGTNTGWYQVASNWLSGPKDKNNGGTDNQYQQDGVAPNSAHILWTKITEDGGLVGGGNFSVPGDTFNAGHQYQTRFVNPIIMWGRLYYELPITWAGLNGGWVCVDLKTGETIWENRDMNGGSTEPAFGYYYDLDDMNNHGIVTPGWLFSTNFAMSIHPRYGITGQLNLTNVPNVVQSSQQLLPTTVYDIIGPKGENLRYELNLNGWLAQWNSTLVFNDAESGKIPANCPITPARVGSTYWNGSMWVSNTVRVAQGYASVTTPAYDWNVTIPWAKGMTGGSETIRGVIYNDVLFGTNGSHPVGTSAPRFDYPTPVTIWAVSLKPGTQGQLIYMKNIDTIPNPPDGGEIMLERVAEGVAVFVKLFERQWIGYDIHTGNKLWETNPPEAEFNPFGYYSFPSLIHTESVTIADGRLFTGGYTGAVMCYNLTTGQKLWQYEDYTGRTVFPYFTLMLGPVADGKIYVGTHEHSADTPLFKGNKVRAINVTDGSEVWAMYGWAHPYTFAVADGTLIYWNNYDHQVYAIAKGPTTMTVDAPKAAVSMGQSLVITGTVMDISAGASQKEQSKRFPNGIPAVSEASMAKWMEYVYMQKARPMDTVGVPIVLSVVDANGNYRDIGTTTSTDGFFAFNWKPDIEGQYTVYASFAGSEGYYPSNAVTAFAVDPAAPTPAPTDAPAESMSDMYFVPAVAGVIVAILVVGVVLALLLLKKRP